jgi:hypothetical protein
LAFEVGQRIIADRSGRRRRQTMDMRTPKHGVVAEVLRGDPRPRYRITWDVGPETIFSPAEGALQADPAYERGKT